LTLSAPSSYYRSRERDSLDRAYRTAARRLRRDRDRRPEQPVAVRPYRVAMRWLKGLIYLPAPLLFATVLAEAGVRAIYPAGAALIADALAQTVRSQPSCSTSLAAVRGGLTTTAGRPR
jgi:hypothetical protein